MPSPSEQPHFNATTPIWARNGALIGAVSVMVASVLLIQLTGQATDLLGVAALGAFFGGAGLGAMLGAVLSEVRPEEPSVEPAVVSVSGD